MTSEALSAERLLQALALPAATQLKQRVPKKMLADHGAATLADKRQIQEGVDDVLWWAALKPHLIGVPAYTDPQRQYLELAVLTLQMKGGAKPNRLIELVHRAVPYPVLLLTTSDAGLGLSLSHLRASQNEADKTVLDGGLLTVTLSAETVDEPSLAAFLAAMALSRQPQNNLYALYQGWFDTVAALDIARETGTFQPSLSREHAQHRHQALQEYCRVRACIEQLRTLANKERQMARQIQLNSEIRDLTQQMAELALQLQGNHF
jgi:hypothetical protein